MSDQYKFQMAIRDFQSARQKAGIQEVLARITGKSTQLLSYDEVAEKLKLRIRTERGLHNIPVDAIVGSVGRYTDFTRSFLPRHREDQQRWARVKAAMEEGEGLPPIEVYKVGEVYFVVDGNHRVSIARQEGFKSVQARVIEFTTHINLTPDVQPDDLIIKAEYAEFLKTTKIMDLRPNVDLTVTIPGQCEKMLHQICEQEVAMELERKSPVLFQDAVSAWYDNIYIPLAETIRDRGLLHWFPERTITDLYMWITENRDALEKELGWEIQSDIAVTDLILERSVPAETGSWRKARMVSRYTDHLFADILVPLSGYEESWDALQQAIVIAKQENARLHGLHVVEMLDDVEGETAQGIKSRFDQTCREAGVEGVMAIDVGDITQSICERAILTDLIVLKLVNPPSPGLSALRSPFRTIIEKSARPLLTVPMQASKIENMLLAFDDSERAREALFVATYFAETWNSKLTIFTALDGGKKAEEAQAYVRRYLDIHEIEADYVVSSHGAKDALVSAVEEHKIDLVLMGSHSGTPLRQVFVGSALDYMLRESKVPTFISR